MTAQTSQNETFTLNKALNIQDKDLETWRPKLSEACFEALSEKCKLENLQLRPTSDPYSVFRGSRMCDFIANWKP